MVSMDTDILLAIISILFGAAVLAYPKFLRLIVGGYFLLYGLLLLLLYALRHG